MLDDEKAGEEQSIFLRSYLPLLTFYNLIALRNDISQLIFRKILRLLPSKYLTLSQIVCPQAHRHVHNQIINPLYCTLNTLVFHRTTLGILNIVTLSDRVCHKCRLGVAPGQRPVRESPFVHPRQLQRESFRRTALRLCCVVRFA